MRTVKRPESVHQANGWDTSRFPMHASSCICSLDRRKGTCASGHLQKWNQGGWDKVASFYKDLVVQHVATVENPRWQMCPGVSLWLLSEPGLSPSGGKTREVLPTSRSRSLFMRLGLISYEAGVGNPRSQGGGE